MVYTKFLAVYHSSGNINMLLNLKITLYNRLYIIYQPRSWKDERIVGFWPSIIHSFTHETHNSWSRLFRKFLHIIMSNKTKVSCPARLRKQNETDIFHFENVSCVLGIFYSSFFTRKRQNKTKC
jgi:hypothetical protein